MNYINTLRSMSSTSNAEKLSWLKNVITAEALVSKDQREIFGLKEKELSWLFDIRNISLQPDVLETIAGLFWEQYSDETHLQIGGLETASIPLITAIILEGKRRGKNVTGFYIRKSRKKIGLVKQIEGKLTQAPVILVDDLINTGKSFARQIELLESERLNVQFIFTVVRFRKDKAYQRLLEGGIRIHSLFTLPDFSIKYLHGTAKITFSLEKYFRSKHASLVHVLPKSVPLIRGNSVYWGTDNGHVWCLDKETLAVKWNRKLGLFTKQHIFASVSLLEDKLYCPTFNGALYVLNAKNGNVIWHDILGEKITATPLILKDERTLIISVCDQKSGNIIAFDIEHLEKLWEYKTEGAISGTGIVSEKDNFIILDNSGAFYLGDRKRIQKIKRNNLRSVIGNLALDTQGTKMYWGAMDGKIYETSASTLKSRVIFQADGGIYGKPYPHNHKLYIPSLDKNLYCLNLEQQKLEWKFETKGRIFASPIVLGNIAYIGSNDARLYAVDVQNGKELGYYQTTERITTPAVVNDERNLLLTTFTNEVYKLTIQREAPSSAGSGH